MRAGDGRGKGSQSTGSLFILSAPSGAGKTTLCRELCRTVSKMKHSVSYTTRARRKGERNGIHYFFVTESRFRKMTEKGEFAEWAMVHGNLYGTSKRHIEEIINRGYDIILDIDVNGARQMRRAYGDAYFVFILPPSLKELEKRLRNRKSDRDDEIRRRLEKAKEEIGEYIHYNYTVVNDRFEKALSDLASVVRTSRLKTEKMPGGLKKKFRLHDKI
jgi:guanylate kinase